MDFFRNGANVPDADLGDLRPADEDGVVRPGDAPVRDLEAGDLPAQALGELFFEDGLPQEIALLELADPLQVGFEDRGLVADVVAVEHELGLEAKGVAGAEPDGHDAAVRALLQDGVPDDGRVRIERVDLEAVLSRVAGPGDKGLDARHLPEREMEGLHPDEVEGSELLEDGDGLGPLEGELGIGVAPVLGRHGEALDVIDDPGVILVGVRGVDDQKIFLGTDAIDEHIVDEGPLGGRQRGVLDLARGQLRRVVRGQVLDEGQGVLAADDDLAHMADVEEPRPGPDGHVLVDDALVFDGHLPPEEFDHPGVPFLMGIVQPGSFHEGVLSRNDGPI